MEAKGEVEWMQHNGMERNGMNGGNTKDWNESTLEGQVNVIRMCWWKSEWVGA